MKYMGSKNKLSKCILPLILKEREPKQYYVEPFVGGANIIDKVTGNRIGNELNPYIHDMWVQLQSGWYPPYINKEEYKDIKFNKNKYPAHLVGWAGIACSYSGKWFGGYAGLVKTKNGYRDYIKEALNNLDKQLPNIKGIHFEKGCYSKLDIPPKSIIYCDPPYKDTTGYKDKFDSKSFFEWCRIMKSMNHTIYISEYEAPTDFKCIFEKSISSSLSANGFSGGNKKSTEKLFTL